MTEQQVLGRGDAAEPALRLHEIAQMLRSARHLGPEEQRALAELADELGNALEQPTSAPGTPHCLTERITHLAEALRHGHTQGPLLDVRLRLQKWAATMEARSPYGAAFARQLVDALAGLGI